ncbi:penicillin-binding protein activator [Shewanella sp. GXUN23E]|uniref:penicillin-binding protein activator n=1 Tax=Shewanella sp. GXUN23E TaxID=3422498 RepID=UPI003D7DF0F3
MLKSIKTTKFIPLVVSAVIMAGCASTQPSAPVAEEVVSLESADNTPAWYLSKIQPNQSLQTQQSYTLLAAWAYLKQGDTGSADKLLHSLKDALNTEVAIQAQKRYLQAQSLQMQSKPEDALAELVFPAQWALQDWQWREYYQLRARLYGELQQPIEQVRQLSSLERYVPAHERNQINDAIWKALQPLSSEQLARFTDDHSNSIFAGWMQLAYLAKHYAVAPNELIRYLGQWQQQNPSHPGAVKLPTDLEKALNTKPYRPQKIAVLLPLTGARANIANPVKQGILSSYLAGGDPQVEIAFYDTATDVVTAYQTAQSQGAEFVIGPLLPDNVNKLQAFLAQSDQMPTALPQLYLNQPSQLSQLQNQYFFALSPSQEAADAAKHLFQDGVKMPLLLVSNDATGQRMAEAFKQEWMQLTDKEAEVHFYPNGDKMGEAVKAALGVRDSEERIARMKQLIGNQLQGDFRSRRDIDAIYMIANAGELTLLKPFIDVSFSVFAQPVPLYTSSRGRLDKDTSQTAIELNNISFSDIPWLIQPNEETAEVANLWPTWRNSQKRLYIMGYDALDLVGRLAQMHAFPGFQYQGRSGELSVTPEGVIERHLSWGKYQRGKLKPL